MHDFDVTVIGAGLGGLSAGALHLADGQVHANLIPEGFYRLKESNWDDQKE